LRVREARVEVAFEHNQNTSYGGINGRTRLRNYETRRSKGQRAPNGKSLLQEATPIHPQIKGSFPFFSAFNYL
jgi:hypothetical protein